MVTINIARKLLVPQFSKTKMAERRTGRFTAEQVAEICAFSDYEAGSNIDSATGGMSSGEEMELDELMCEEIDSEADLG